MQNTCVLWDIENVTPGANSLFVDGLSEYAESLGRVISARAYCDWSKPNFKKLAPQLVARLSFYLVHVPREKSGKKSADMQLVSDALEMLTTAQHIEAFVLITGDSDFRPLVLALRRAGKMIHIVCDLKNASQDLLAVADTFRDFRELLPGGDVEEEEPRELEDPRGAARQAKKTDSVSSPEYWYEALGEAAGIMMDEGKTPNPGTVKIRLRMLNPNFDERNLGFRRWSDFVTAAARAGFVKIEEQDRQTIVNPGRQYTEIEGTLHQAFAALEEVLTELDGDGPAKPHEYAMVNQRLMKTGVDVKALGYRQFKAFVQAAETRGLVESQFERLNHFVKRTEQPPQQHHRRRR